MDEQSIFLAALEKETPESQARWLAEICGTDHVLKARIEALLHSHREANSFLERPAPELEATITFDAVSNSLTASLEAGLSAAFSEESALVIGNASHSVLEALGQSMPVPRVVLRNAEGADPIVRPKSPEMPDRNSDSRYRLDGEIARGGMGAILKGRDTDLGRDLAIKVLLDAHKNKPEIVQRFIEEAQIGGQLQHPGIAPVYELGQFADRRPFFSMKLVKGETLSKLLADREVPTADRGKYLGIFEQICQTMAYAHSRGVIHRDLKPANIMVGAFGEVQVMDWGLAKVLPAGGVADEKRSFQKQQGQSIIQTLRSGPGSDAPGTCGSIGSQTQMGSVMGTPAYMPPEQALGEIDNLDERADVFGLGAILCEILTGKPPYVGDDATQVFRLASRGKLEDCFGRLDACEADVELIALAKHCLELELKDRPRDAGVLAERISTYLQSVDTKLREAELERAAQAARLEQEQRSARKLRKLLAGIAMVALVAGLACAAALVANKRANDLANVASQNEAAAQASAAKADQHAEGAKRQTKLAERHLYLAHMNLAQSAWEQSNVDQTVRLLDLYRPGGGLPAGADDLRGFEWYYWDHCCHSDLMTLSGHSEMVFTVAFSPDGKRLASASADKTIKVWDAATGQESLTLAGRAGSIFCVVFSPNGQRLASTSDDNTVRVCDAETGQESPTLRGHTRAVNCVAFSPDGKRLASASDDNTVKVWDAVAGEESLTIKGHNGPVTSVAFSPDGQRLVTASLDGLVKGWVTATGAESFSLQGHTSWVYRAVFSPNGRLVASASHDQTVKVWDTATRLATFTLKGHTHPVRSVAFSPDGGRLASASIDQTIRVWDTASGQETLILKGHTRGIRQVTFSPDGQRLATASEDRTVKLWDAAMNQESLTLKGPAPLASVTFSPDGLRVASGSHDQTVKVWDAATGQESFTLTGHTASVIGVAFSPDGHRLASASDDKTVKVWDMSTGLESITLTGHTQFVRSVAFSPNGQRLASCSADRTVKVWDAATGQDLLTLKGHTDDVWSVVFSTDGDRLASASLDGTVKVWNATTGDAVRTLNGHSGRVWSVAFSSDGRLASANDDNTVKVWDIATGRELFSLNGHAHGVRSVAFSPDGQRLASTSYDHTIKVWDTATGQESLTLKGSADAVLGVTFSPDGQRLATAGWDQMARVWDARPWTPELKIEQQALNVLHFWCAQPISRETLILKIRNQPAISSAVRQRTQELAETYQQRAELQVTHPFYLDEERKQRSLLINGSFEDQMASPVWTSASWRNNPRAAAIEEGVAYTGKRSVLLATDVADDVRFSQDVAVQADTDYLLCGWVKTERVEFQQEGRIGANLSLFGSYQRSQAVSGDSDWTYLALTFNSGGRTSVQVCARLGHQSSTCTGKAWFDDLYLIPLEDAGPQPGAEHSWHEREAKKWFAGKRWKRALLHLEALIETDPASRQLRIARGTAFAELGEMERAAGEFEALYREQAELPVAAALALAWRAAGRTDDARALCLALLDEYEGTDKTNDANTVAYLGALLLEGPENLRRCVALAERAVQKEKSYETLNTLGVALLRAGNYVAARERLEESARQSPQPNAWDLLFLALTDLRENRSDDASVRLARAREWIATAQAGTLRDPHFTLPLTWALREELRALVAEVERELTK